MSTPSVSIPERSYAPFAAPNRRPRRRWRLALLIVAAVVLAATAWLAVRGLQARSALTAAVPQVERLQAHLLAGDGAAARLTLDDLQAATERARARTSDPVWALASHVPWVGSNFDAVAGVAVGLDDLADTVLPSVVDSAGALDLRALTPVDGRVELAPLIAAAPLMAEASAAMAAIDAGVQAIRTDNVLGAIAGPVSDLQTQLADFAHTLRTAERAAVLLPSMLGADGPRSYLLLLQSNAELRSTGGMPGALSVITADDGRIALTEQATASEVYHSGVTPLPLAAEDEALYSHRMGVFMADVNFTPHFPTAAELAREMWRQYSGDEVDGVLATDPVALSYLLEATGPVADGTGGELAAGDAVDMLLSGAYERFPEPADQDAYFAAVSANVFQALLDGRARPAASVPALARAAEEHRLLVWSARPEENAQLEGTVLTGAMTGMSSATTSSLGVFFNDGTGSKMDYYLDTSVELLDTRCGVEGAVHTVRVELVNTAPADAATTLGRSVVGLGTNGTAPGEIATSVILVGPAAGAIGTLVVDGRLIGTAAHEQGGRPATTLSLPLTPGDRTTLEFTMTDPTPGDVLDIWSTPTKDQSGLRAAPNCV